MSSTIFDTSFDLVDVALNNYVSATSSDLISFISPIFTSLMIIWVVIWGYVVMFGHTGEPLTEGFFRIIRVSFIITLGLTVGYYGSVVTEFATGWPETISAVLVGSPSTSAASSLDTLFSKVFSVAADAWSRGGVMSGDFGQYFMAIIVLLFGGSVTLIAAFLILSSKVLTAVLLAIGPLAISLLLFKTTQRFFESWLGMLINQGFVLVLSTAIGKMLIDICNTFIDGNPTSSTTLASTAMLCIVLGLSVLTLKQVPPIAAALGGGVALATQGAISKSLDAMRPSTIRRQARGIGRDYVATKAGIKATKNALTAPKRAYQKRFGSNSVSQA